jgi:hypothetical protein
MLDFDTFRAEGQALIEEIAEALRIDFPLDLMTKLCEAALGKTGLELHRLTIFYAEEADKCRSAGAWFAACTMVASAIEGVLALFCILAKDEVENSQSYSMLIKGGGSYEDRVLNATFEKLIRVASELEWVPSDAVDPEILQASRQDFPQVLRNLFPALSFEEKAKKIRAFEAEPGMEMLRMLQYLRNLVHPPRCRRLGVKLGSIEFESDCKFAYIIAFPIMTCLFAAMARKANTKMRDLSGIIEELPPQARTFLVSYVLQAARVE